MKAILIDDMSVTGAYYQLVPKGTVLNVAPLPKGSNYLEVKGGPYAGLTISKDSICIRLEETDAE